jgi:hypothetical protein
MRLLNLFLPITAGLICGALNTNANLTFTDTEIFDPALTLTAFTSQNQHSGTFDISGSLGFNHNVTDFSVEIVISNVKDGLIDPIAVTVLNKKMVDVDYLDDGSSFVETWSTADNKVSGQLIGALNQYGTLTYSVVALWGSFSLDSATLTAHAPDAAGNGETSVPDGGTAAGLLGLALCGLGAAARKLHA